jgi:uncharacterized protein (DUF362 family)
VIARDESLRLPSGVTDPQRLLGMLDRALLTLFDRDRPAEVWRQLVHPGEVVGLKVNCLSGRGNSTSAELVDAVCERLREAGIPNKDILIWDRLNEDLERGGFRIVQRGRGPRCCGNDVLGYETALSTHGAAASRLCVTLTRVCDCVINMPSLKDHSIAGVTIALKNMFGAIHNPNKYHLNAGDPYVADVSMLPDIRTKTRLVICDATNMQYEGGPSFLPQWNWPFDGLLVGTDPVALDRIGWNLIETRRSEAGLRPISELGRMPRYIATAADSQHHLGIDDLGRIEVIEV